MTQREARILFTKLLCELVRWGNDQPGWEIALGRDFDERVEPLHHMNGSLHYIGLANDLALYVNGEYEKTTEGYRALGEKWKGMHPLCRWGGDFSKPDGNHFAIMFGGKA